LGFEDSALIGFCVQVANPTELMNWKSIEDEIVGKFATTFRAAGEKAWNVYSIFLCDQLADANLRREIGWIEENLDRTRKIAASGVSNREALVRALLPVLPIQYRPVLPEADTTERLRKRIADIAPQAQHIALDPAVDVAEVVRLMGVRS
jgi:hypothetical protein